MFLNNAPCIFYIPVLYFWTVINYWLYIYFIVYLKNYLNINKLYFNLVNLLFYLRNNLSVFLILVEICLFTITGHNDVPGKLFIIFVDFGRKKSTVFNNGKQQSIIVGFWRKRWLIAAPAVKGASDGEGEESGERIEESGERIDESGERREKP